MGRGKAPAEAIAMSEFQKEILSQLNRNHSTPQQIVKRINILLLASEGLSNAEIARTVLVSYKTVLTWRKRWLLKYKSLCIFEKVVIEQGQSKNVMSVHLLTLLKDTPRSGAPKIFTLAQREQIVALSCEAPIDYGLELTNWTHQMLAKTVIAKGIVTTISPSHLGKILKNTPFTTS